MPYDNYDELFKPKREPKCKPRNRLNHYFGNLQIGPQPGAYLFTEEGADDLWKRVIALQRYVNFGYVTLSPDDLKRIIDTASSEMIELEKRWELKLADDKHDINRVISTIWGDLHDLCKIPYSHQ